MNLKKSINIGCAYTETNKNELASHLGVTPTTVSRYSSGDSEPTLETLREIASFFGVSVSEFIKWGE